MNAVFNVSHQTQYVSVNPLEITGNTDDINSFLNVPITFTFSAIKQLIFDINTLYSTVRLQSRNAILSETVQPFVQTITKNSGNSGTPYIIRFPLSERAIALIEKYRTGDVTIQLEIKLIMKVGEAKPVINNSPVTLPLWSHSEFHVSYVTITIPRSLWIERILPNLGYQTLRLVEIPVKHNVLNEAYDNIILAFNAAEKYYNQHDYNQCVAHCRNTLETLHKELQRFKNEVGSKSNFTWLDKTTSETVAWIKEMDKQTYRMTSKAHHEVTVEYTRSEAQSIYLVVLGLMHYIGSL
jgi:hypothetical protein